MSQNRVPIPKKMIAASIDDRFGVTIKQSRSAGQKHDYEPTANIDQNDVREPDWSETLSLCFLGVVFGLLCGVILCAVLRHK